ncbi:MAG: SDR family oxidoreductase [Gammaproteobacteria bacterium]|nr:MAG: SDR family oxidoreductase [Gammaproteobacteria bacterium]
MHTEPLDFSGKVVLITGGATGIGRAAAVAFADRGARLIIGDVNEAQGRLTVGLAQSRGAEALFVPTDVSKEGDVVALVEAAVGTYGQLDCAFNNAGVATEPTPLHEMDERLFDQVVAVDLKGVFLCLKHELAHMTRNGGGAIVNTASVAGLVPEPGMSNYVAAKHGVLGLTKAAGLDYAAWGIRVNAVAPGWVETPMTSAVENVPGLRQFLCAGSPMHRPARPEEIAGTVLYLCSDYASYITGQTFIVDGGQSVRGLFPGSPPRSTATSAGPGQGAAR